MTQVHLEPEKGLRMSVKDIIKPGLHFSGYCADLVLVPVGASSLFASRSGFGPALVATSLGILPDELAASQEVEPIAAAEAQSQGLPAGKQNHPANRASNLLHSGWNPCSMLRLTGGTRHMEDFMTRRRVAFDKQGAQCLFVKRVDQLS